MPAGRTHPLRRLLAGLVAAALVSTGLVVALAAPASAAARAFTPVYTGNEKGDVVIRGNTLMTCPAGSVSATGAATTCAAGQTGSGAVNNNFKMTYVDVDADTTFDSSSTTLTIPTGATVLYAGLSWGGNTAAGGNLTGHPEVDGVVAPNANAKNVAKFKAPGASAYTAVTASTVDTNGALYQAFANVTSTVSGAGSGTYTVADVQAGTGGGSYAGWSLAVAYRDATQPLRNLVIFTGFDTVSSSTNPSLDLPVSGFTTPTTGPVVTRLGVVAYEGDRGNTGDSLSLGGTTISNTLNPANDVFNASITDLNVAVTGTGQNPNYTNQLGFDIDRFDASGILVNGSTSTTIHLTTSGDSYYPGLLTFATDLNASALVATKTAIDLNGGVLAPSDKLAYTISLTNTGGDGATGSVLRDAVPTGTSYLAGSLKIDGSAITDTAGNDAGEVNAGNVTARLGTGASSTAGGLIPPSVTTTVSFTVTVFSTATDGTNVVNTATTAYNNATTGTGYAGASNTVTNRISTLALTFIAPPAGEVGSAYTTTFTGNGGATPYSWSTSAGTFPAGLTLDAGTGVLSGTPTATGSYDVTVQLTDANGAAVTRAVTGLAIAAAPTLTYAAPPTGEINTAYGYQLTKSGGTGPYTWTIGSGTLPTGITLSSTGLLSGTPTTAGSSTFTVMLTDTFQSVSRGSSITIVAGPALTFTAPADGEVGVGYTTTFTAAGGTTAYTWTRSAGTLPAGLVLNSGNGKLTGTPTAAGTFSFTIKVTDANGQIDTRATSIIVAPAVALTFPAPPAGQIDTTYGTLLTRSGGVGPYGWSVSTGTLPAGLLLDAGTGLLSGTPTALGTSTLTVTVTDAVGGTDSKAVTLVVDKSTATLVTTGSVTSVRFGTSMTVTTTASGPGTATGTVTFTDEGPTGSAVALGSVSLTGGAAQLPLTLPAFGANSITASYAGDATHAPASAPVLVVEVNGYLGEVIVSEFRSSGPGGDDDSYVELYNTGPAVPLAGFAVQTSSGTTTTLPADAGVLGNNRSYLLTGSGYSLGAIGHSDHQVASIGRSGLKVLAPDTAATRTDAVGPAGAFHRGTVLATLTGSPTGQYAWWRVQQQGRPVDTGDNAADFQLVSKGGGQVGDQQSTLGAPSPTGSADPYQHNATLQSTLLDPTKAVTASPNRSYTAGSPGTLTIRRTITNTTGATVTSAVVRTTALSEANGVPLPGQPTSHANLRAINPATATSRFTVGGVTRTVSNLSIDAPNTASPGAGLNSTFTVPLNGGLAAGASIDIAFTFAVDTTGAFWFGYDVDALTGTDGAARPMSTRQVIAPSTPRDSGQLS